MKNIDMHQLATDIINQKRRALAQAITLIESSKPEHQKQAQELLALLQPKDATLRVGISGPPGAGKSTFIDTFGCHMAERGHAVAVLAIDPSSRHTGGSILGDKTRMHQLAQMRNAFIRPSPNQGLLGGIAPKSYETIILCEASGYDLILIETVGVGQAEVDVDDIVDMFVLILPPASGDTLQGIKRGIIEASDMILVNKNDGDTQAHAQRTAQHYQAAMTMITQKHPFWQTPVIAISARHKTALADVEKALLEFKQKAEQSGQKRQNRFEQKIKAFDKMLKQQINQQITTHPKMQKAIENTYDALKHNRITPEKAVHNMIIAFSTLGVDESDFYR